MDGMANYAPIAPELEGVSAAFPLSAMNPSLGEYFDAQAGTALRDSGTSSVFRAVELGGAEVRETGGFDEFGVYQPGTRPAAKRFSAEYAKARAEEAGVTVDFGTADYTEDAVNIMIDRARRKAVRDEIIQAYDPSIATSLGVSVAATLIDPVNVASAFIPVVGEARYLGLLAGASSFAGRTGVRAAVGAAEGAFGAVLLEPAIYYAATQEGRDYSLADSLANLAFGTALGGGLHISGGTFMEKVLGRTYANAPIISPPDMVDRLPIEAKRAALQAAIADLHAGRGVQAQDVIDQLTELDPELGKAVLYAQTLKRDGPPIDDTEARIAFWEGKLAGKRQPGKVENFAAWVRSKGGVRDIDGVLELELGKGHGLPSSLFITARGAKRSQRGVDFEALYLEAVNEGFVTTKREFIDAFRSHAGGVVAPVVRRADSLEADKIAEELEYIKAALAAAGVNPRANNATKARAITGREQHVVAAERARLQGALARLEERQKAILRGEEPKPEPKPDDKKPEPEKLPTSKEEEVEVGDTVETAEGEEFTFGGGQGARVTQVYNDPVYGKWVSVEGSSSAIEVGRVKVKKKGERSPDTLSAQVEADQKPQPTPKQTGTFEQAAFEIGDAFAQTRGGAVSMEALKERLPGVSNSKLEGYINRLIKSDDIGSIERGADGKITRIFKRNRLTEDQTVAMSKDHRIKIEQARRNLDAQYPGMATQRTYYLRSLFDSYRDKLEMGAESFRKVLNEDVKKGLVRIIDEETGEDIVLDKRHFDDRARDQPDILIVFKDAAKPSTYVAPKPSLLPTRPGKDAAPVVEQAVAQPMRLAQTEVREDGTLAFDIMRGDVVAAQMRVFPNPETKTLIVEDIVSAAAGKKAGSLKPAFVREIIDALAEAFPGYEKVTGFRATGARGKAREAGGKPNMEMELPLKKRTAAEKEAEETGEALAAAGPRSPMPDTPPAERAALTSKEIGEVESQLKALEAKTLKRLDSLLATVSPETAATIRSQLAKIDMESKDLASVYESAVQCLLKP